MQRAKLQLYTGTCTPLKLNPLYLQLATERAVPHPGDPPQWGTCVSLSLITPPHHLAKCVPLPPPAVPNKNRSCSFISLSIHWCIVLTALLPPWASFPPLCPLPCVPCGGRVGALSPCLDPDTNHKGRELNDGINKYSYWLWPTLVWTYTCCFQLTVVTSFPFTLSCHSWWQEWQWCRLFTM